MNSSAAVMLFEENGVRPVRVEYDPENSYQNKGADHTKFFKCVDPDIKKDDLVIVQTTTRQGFTVAKVTAIGYEDVQVDFDNSSIEWRWVAGKLDKTSFDDILAGEKNLLGKVHEANANKMREDMKNAMGLSKVNLGDVFGRQKTQLAGPFGQQAEVEEVPAAPVRPVRNIATGEPLGDF